MRSQVLYQAAQCVYHHLCCSTHVLRRLYSLSILVYVYPYTGFQFKQSRNVSDMHAGVCAYIVAVDCVAACCNLSSCSALPDSLPWQGGYMLSAA